MSPSLSRAVIILAIRILAVSQVPTKCCILRQMSILATHILAIDSMPTWRHKRVPIFAFWVSATRFIATDRRMLR
jgi:hypothetical protein